jgi:hypothetical protein
MRIGISITANSLIPEQNIRFMYWKLSDKRTNEPKMNKAKEWMIEDGLTYANAAFVLKCSVTRAWQLYHGQLELTDIELVRIRSSQGQWSEVELVGTGRNLKARIGAELVQIAPGHARAVASGKIKPGIVQVILVNTRKGEGVRIQSTIVTDLT